MDRLNDGMDNPELYEVQSEELLYCELYDAVDRLNELKPWNYFCEIDVCEIYLKGDDEPYYCSVNGMFEKRFSVAFYRGHEGLVSLSNYLNLAEGPGYISESRKNCLECDWGERNRLKKRDLACIRKADRKYRGQEAWPRLRFCETGYEPFYLSYGQVKEFTAVARELCCALEELQRDGILGGIGEGERIRRKFDSALGVWVNDIMPPVEKIEAVTDGCVITDELLIRRINKKPLNGRYLEVDMPYVPFVFKENIIDGRCRYPQLCMICDAERAAVECQYILGNDEDPRDILLGMLVNYMEQRGRPQCIYVRDAVLFGIIGDLCNKTGVEVSFIPMLKILDFFVEDIIEHFSV